MKKPNVDWRFATAIRNRLIHGYFDVDAEIIKRSTQFPNFPNYEMVYSGPHLFVSNPLYKTPRKGNSYCRYEWEWQNDACKTSFKVL